MIGIENNDNENIQETEMSMEELLKEENTLNKKVYSKENIQVKVVEVSKEYVFVDIGEKKEGIIDINEFSKTPEVGSTIIAVLERRGDDKRNPVLSHKKAIDKITFELLNKAFLAKERVKGKVLEAVKGGYIVDVSGLRSFMPLSLSEIGGSPKHYLPLNAKIKFYITDIDERSKKIIISRRQVLEEDEKERRQLVLSETKEGQITRVVISRIIDAGLFVRYQGMEGFINLIDVSWKDPKEALKKYKRGERIKVKILRVDKENQKITFGIKQTQLNPIDFLKKKFPFNTQLKVKVQEAIEGGFKVHIFGDVYGTIIERDYSYNGAPKIGEELNVVVIGVNTETYELKLSIKKLEDLEDKKRIQQYLKGSPKLTLGQILMENSQEEDTDKK